jgi:hypothetical protein
VAVGVSSLFFPLVTGFKIAFVFQLLLDSPGLVQAYRQLGFNAGRTRPISIAVTFGHAEKGSAVIELTKDILT